MFYSVSQPTPPDTAPISVFQSYPSLMTNKKIFVAKSIVCSPQINWRARPILYGLKWHSRLYHRYAKTRRGGVVTPPKHLIQRTADARHHQVG